MKKSVRSSSCHLVYNEIDRHPSSVLADCHGITAAVFQLLREKC
jgi:hypothetical protein